MDRVDTSPRYYVFSDVDETLISLKSMLDFLSFYFTRHHGPEGARKAAAVQEDLAAQAAAGIPRETASLTYYRAWTGQPAPEVTRAGRQWHRERSADNGFYLPHTRAALAHHHAQGAAIVLVSGAFPAVLTPIAQDINATHILCTRPEQHNNTLTGNITGTPMIGTHKRTAIRTLLHNNPRIDPAHCYAYADHITDLPMLTEVGHPVVIGTDTQLTTALPAAPQLPTH
ncbi:HAD-IB family hydrolase [Streptomyces sp. NPDC090499]|uniref:HAD-IB family hydrolase n=1 Tax=unclassified Streptomyces TaxID=2593676 RepID=UPI003810CBE0